MVNLEQKIVVKVAFSTAEREKLETYFEKLMSKVDPSDQIIRNWKRKLF
jgi:RNA-binding protein YhbY